MAIIVDVLAVQEDLVRKTSVDVIQQLREDVQSLVEIGLRERRPATFAHVREILCVLVRSLCSPAKEKEEE